jgi:hypothetical protein
VIEEALVDSGAHTTLLPVRVAEELGITRALRRASSPKEAAGGAPLQTWTTDQEVEVQVYASAEEFVGPTMLLRPEFVKPRRRGIRRARGTELVACLGMDFFAHCAITFEPAPTPVLHLSW